MISIAPPTRRRSPHPTGHVQVRGARAHNLQDLDLDLPCGQWIALTGPSGSGKTTLAFDVLHREGQRRYLGALSARARFYLDKLGPAEVDAVRGLPVTLATGQGALTRSPRSTVGTLVGLLDLLRLLFARAGQSPEPLQALTRSHFSFNTEQGACPACKGLGVEDQVHPPLLIADASKSLRGGALRPTLPNGYTVYSQVTLEVMDLICQAHGFDVDTPWSALTDAQRAVIFYGTRALTVPFGKHSLASRMTWTGITARPREEGYYRGLIPVIEETLKRDRNPNILRYVRSVPCSICDGARLGPVGRGAHIDGVTLPSLLALPTAALGEALDALPASEVLAALRPALDQRLRRMAQLALGHLSLDRSSTTLSDGEGQRLRLAAQLNSHLGGMLIVLDEPTLGLHPSAQPGMAAILEELRGLGNTVLVVDHDPHMVQRADHWLALGPGAGPEGGRIVHDRPMPDEALAVASPVPAPVPPPEPATADERAPSPGALRLRGATLNNLDGVTLTVPLSAMTVVSGPSGAGKSSLVFGTLLPALHGQDGGPFAALEGVPEGLSARWVDARPIGKTPRSTPATYTGLFDLVRKRFAATAAAKALGLSASRFSYNNKAGRCTGCEGLGVQRVGMHLLQDVEQTCAVCGGGRYAPEVLAARLRGRTIAEVLALTVDEAVRFFAEDPPAHALCDALSRLGLGYLQLGQSSSTLSRGEAQRVKLAALLGRPPRGASLILLDEPDRGLHPADITRLLAALRALVQAGHTVLAVSHHPMLWRAADRRFALREGRRVDPESPPPLPRAAPRPPAAPPTHIRLRGVRTNALDGLDADFEHGRITAVTGVSGSGKSSLVFHTLAAEAWSRFAESLPFQVRRFVRQLPRPDLDSAEGLTPVLSLRQDQGRPGPRATVGTLSQVDADLRLIWSRLGEVDGSPAGLSVTHFSPNQTVGACAGCAGRGAVMRCEPTRLLSHPDKPLGGGGMAGSKPGRFFGEPDGQYMATLRVAAEALGLDVSAPWSELPEAARRLALDGAGERVFEVRWDYVRGKRSGSHTFTGPWVGLAALVEGEAKVRALRKDAAAWAECLAPTPCPACGGERLSPAARAVVVSGLRLPSMSRLRLTALLPALEGLSVPEARRPVLAMALPGALRRLGTLVDLGLGHLSLARPADTLSSGELQRLRLAEVLDSDLRGLTLALDEPGAGLDDAALTHLAARLRAFCEAGNTVIMVSHREALTDAADAVLTLGSRAPLQPLPSPPALPADAGRITIRGARAHTLQGFDLELPDRGVIAITGPSGSGKSTLAFDVLGASAAAAAPRGCDAVTGLERFTHRHLTRAPSGQSPLAALGLGKAMQALFHGVGGGLSRASFNHNSPAGRCPDCKGSGVRRVAMDFMADLSLDCPTCEGRRYRPEVLAVRWQGLTAADFLERPVAALKASPLSQVLAEGVDALCALGLGHLSLGRRPHTLSGGERQRVALAAALRRGADGPGLYLLDEPGAGLHSADLDRLIAALHALAERGDLAVFTTHRRRLMAAAHTQVTLGPGGGDQGGRLM